MTVLLTPVNPATDLAAAGGRSYRKQILPLGSITYSGRRLDFTREYLQSLVDAFKRRAYDAVPFLFANGSNEHHSDPAQIKGEVRALELTHDGLDAVIEMSDEQAAALVSKHPAFGVSARIIEGLTRADGQAFPRAIEHVLGTIAPRVTGMRPWQAVELSVGDDVSQAIVDLSGLTFETKTKGPHMSASELRKQVDTALDDLSEEDMRALLEAVTADPEGDTPEPEKAEITPAPETPSAEPVATAGEKSSEPMPAPAGMALAGAGAGTELSGADGQTIDLAGRLAAAEGELTSLRAERVDNEAAQLIADGVPPAAVNLARPVLAAGETVDLSISDGINAVDVVRGLLAQMKGTIDLSERGHNAETDMAADERAALKASWPQD